MLLFGKQFFNDKKHTSVLFSSMEHIISTCCFDAPLYIKTHTFLFVYAQFVFSFYFYFKSCNESYLNLIFLYIIDFWADLYWLFPRHTKRCRYLMNVNFFIKTYNPSQKRICSGISINRTLYKADIFFRQTIYLGTDEFTVKIL